MKHSTALTYQLPDGSLCNPIRRLTKHGYTFVEAVNQVPDPRSRLGRRHPLALLITILLLGLLAGYTSLKDCLAWVENHPEFLQFLSHPHGLPHATTITRALDHLDMVAFQGAIRTWYEILPNWEKPTVVSLDGKTMGGVPAGTDTEPVTRHILSLFAHTTHQTLAQIGVSSKENEIPAGQRLLQTVNLTGLTVVADALHTQIKTAGVIKVQGGDYLLMVKDNQLTLEGVIATTFTDPLTVADKVITHEVGRGRVVTTEVYLTQSVDLKELQKDWQDIQYVGKIHRFGTRTVKGVVSQIDEIVYFIASHKQLTAEMAAAMIKEHWEIENNLHWQKDWTYREDVQRLRTGVLPQVMTYLRSLCIGLITLLGFQSVTETVKVCQMNGKRQLTIIKAAQLC